MRVFRLLPVSFALFLGLQEPCALAGNIQIQPIFNQTGAWDTNPLMVTEGRKTVYGSTTSPKLLVTNETPRSKLSASAWVDQNFFSDSSYNSTDLHATTALSRRNERWEALFKGAVDYDTTRTSELTNFGMNVGKVRHFSYTVGPEVAFMPTALDRVSLASQFQKAVYKSDAYSDYSTLSLTPSYTRSLTPLTSGLFSVQAQRFQSERDPKRRVDSIGPTIGFSTKLTPSFSLDANAGSQASKERQSGEDDEKWKWHYVYSGGLSYKNEQNELRLGASRSRQPFGNGRDSLLTSFDLNNSHALNERLTWLVNGSYKFANYDSDTNRDLDSMASGRTELSYRLTETVNLSANYAYQNERLTDGGERAERNIAKLALTYRPQPF